MWVHGRNAHHYTATSLGALIPIKAELVMAECAVPLQGVPLKKPAVLVCVALLASYTSESVFTISAAQKGGPSPDANDVVAQNALGYAALRNDDTTTAIAAFSTLARTY